MTGLQLHLPVHQVCKLSTTYLSNQNIPSITQQHFLIWAVQNDSSTSRTAHPACQQHVCRTERETKSRKEPAHGSTEKNRTPSYYTLLLKKKKIFFATHGFLVIINIWTGIIFFSVSANGTFSMGVTLRTPAEVHKAESVSQSNTKYPLTFSHHRTPPMLIYKDLTVLSIKDMPL